MIAEQTQAAARMLVVDDDLRSRKLLEGYLRAEGYEVRIVHDGLAALAIVEEYLPDVILLDVMMPDMNGYEVCATLKSDPLTRLCQVMLVTALDGTPDKVAGLDTGADDYVTKPVRREEFLAKVRTLLRARRLLLELEQARAQLAARNAELQLKKTLVQSLVHDLKSPLAAILGNLDLLEMRTGVNQQPMIHRCKQGTSRLLKMIMNLLDVEGLEEGKLVLRRDRVDATELVRATLEEAEVAARQSDIQLFVQGDAHAVVEADPQLLRRVVDNLVSNAVSHSPTGGRVYVTLSQRDEGVEIAIADEGPGIPEEYRERVFEKYTQLGESPMSSSSNRGLGLTFCRLAVEAHGGSIWIETAPGGGACFRTLLPSAAILDLAPNVSGKR